MLLKETEGKMAEHRGGPEEPSLIPLLKPGDCTEGRKRPGLVMSPYDLREHQTGPGGIPGRSEIWERSPQY